MDNMKAPNPTCRASGTATNCKGCLFSPLEQMKQAAGQKITPRVNKAQYCLTRIDRSLG
jgi:hypothetical protein